MRARIAAMKPKAAVTQLSAAGTTSCRAPQVRPPSGKWASIVPKPKGRALRSSPILGMSRRSSAITAARLRVTVRAVGSVMVCNAHTRGKLWDIHCMFPLADTRTKEEQCQG
jgi:hypothetical protein